MLHYTFHFSPNVAFDLLMPKGANWSHVHGAVEGFLLARRAALSRFARSVSLGALDPWLAMYRTGMTGISSNKENYNATVPKTGFGSTSTLPAKTGISSAGPVRVPSKPVPSV